jgi:hypothetical protein
MRGLATRSTLTAQRHAPLRLLLADPHAGCSRTDTHSLFQQTAFGVG